MEFGIASVAAITAICYLVGLIVKATPLDSKYVPAICGLAGRHPWPSGAVHQHPRLPGHRPADGLCGWYRLRAGGHWHQSGGEAVRQWVMIMEDEWARGDVSC